MIDTKQKLIEYLKGLDFNGTDNEVYDELQALIETLYEYNIIDVDAYDDAEATITEVWGFKECT